MHAPRTAALAAITLLLALAAPAAADWSLNGNWSTDSINGQINPHSAPDGQGGLYVAWSEFALLSWEVYAQHFDANGNRLWGDGGVPVCTAIEDQFVDDVAVDDSGNFYIAWEDYRSGLSLIYAQMVDGAGNPSWTLDGVAMTNSPWTQSYCRIVIDNATGNAIVMWQDSRSLIDYDIYGQLIKPGGVLSWGAGGLGICTVAQNQLNLELLEDGAGGAIVVFSDFRNTTDYDVYAQRVDATGVLLWGAAAKPVVTKAQAQQDPAMAGDGNGGVIIAWEDGTVRNIYAQRLDASGAQQWQTSGVPVCLAPDDQYDPLVISDDNGGVIIAWEDYRSALDYDVYAARLAGSGSRFWGADGLKICNNSADQFNPVITSDGAGGAIFAFEDDRSGDNNIWVQRVTYDGTILWGSTATSLITASGSQSVPAIQSDGNGNALVAFYDSRDAISRAYTQRVDGRHGYWGQPEPGLYSVADTPGDQGGYVTVSWFASQRDKLGQSLVTHYSVWRATQVLPSSVAGADMVELSQVKLGDTGPAYRMEKTEMGNYFWELVGTQQALYAPGYSYNAATRADSTGGDPADHVFQIVAHTYSDFIFWPSLTGSGHSVDNLAPAAPLMLTAVRNGSDVDLEWDPAGVLEGDFSNFVVYRKTSAGVDPEPLFYLSETPDTVYTDTTADAATAYWYIVTAKDVHENQSDPSNEAMVDATSTGITLTPALTRLQVQPNAPNPFNASTEIRFGLPERADVTFEVFDVLGRRVFARALPGRDAGWNAVSFDGRDTRGTLLPSGVYFYRVTAAGVTETRKMVIGR